jgi:hypothetical protein
MRRNLIFGSDSSRPSSQLRASNRKAQICQRSAQPAQASPIGYFRHPRCLQRFGSSFRSFENSFARAVWKEQMAVLFRIASAPHGHARPQAQHSHGETQTTPASWSFSRHRSFHGHVSHSPAALHGRTVGTGNHKTASDTVRAADALWDAQGGHGAMVAAATTHRSRSPAPTGGKTSDKRNGNARSKCRPPSRPAFHAFQNPANGVCKFHNYYSNRAHRCTAPCTFSEN